MGQRTTRTKAKWKTRTQYIEKVVTTRRTMVITTTEERAVLGAKGATAYQIVRATLLPSRASFMLKSISTVYTPNPSTITKTVRANTKLKALTITTTWTPSSTYYFTKSVVLDCALADTTATTPTPTAEAMAQQRAVPQPPVPSASEPLSEAQETLQVGPLSLESIDDASVTRNMQSEDVSVDVGVLQEEQVVPLRKLNKRHEGCASICTARTQCYVTKYATRTLSALKKKYKTVVVTRKTTSTTTKVVVVSAGGSCQNTGGANGTTCQVARAAVVGRAKAPVPAIDLKATILPNILTTYAPLPASTVLAFIQDPNAPAPTYTKSFTASQTRQFTSTVATASVLCKPELKINLFVNHTGQTAVVPPQKGLLSESVGAKLRIRNVGVQRTQHGFLKLVSSGAFNYTPDHDWSGPDHARVEVVDKEGTVLTDKVPISVIPLAVRDDYRALSGVPLLIPVSDGLLGNDEGHILAAKGGIATSLYGATVEVFSNGSFLYFTHDYYDYPPLRPGEVEDTFNYTAIDFFEQEAQAKAYITIKTLGYTRTKTASETMTLGAAAPTTQKVPATSTKQLRDRQATTTVAPGGAQSLTTAVAASAGVSSSAMTTRALVTSTTAAAKSSTRSVTSAPVAAGSSSTFSTSLAVDPTNQPSSSTKGLSNAGASGTSSTSEIVATQLPQSTSDVIVSLTSTGFGAPTTTVESSGTAAASESLSTSEAAVTLPTTLAEALSTPLETPSETSWISATESASFVTSVEGSSVATTTLDALSAETTVEASSTDVPSPTDSFAAGVTSSLGASATDTQIAGATTVFAAAPTRPAVATTTEDVPLETSTETQSQTEETSSLTESSSSFTPSTSTESETQSSSTSESLTTSWTATTITDMTSSETITTETISTSLSESSSSWTESTTSETQTTSTTTFTTSTVTPFAAVGGHVFIDWDLDGTYSGGDGISGVVMNLLGYNDLGALVNLTVITKPDGTYTFRNIRPGTYNVTERQPTGVFNSPFGPQTEITGIVLLNAQDSMSNDFAELVTWTRTTTVTKTSSTSLTATTSETATDTKTSSLTSATQTNTRTQSATKTRTSTTSATQSKTRTSATKTITSSLTRTLTSSESATTTETRTTVETATTTASETATTLSTTTSESATRTTSESKTSSVTATRTSSESKTSTVSNTKTTSESKSASATASRTASATKTATSSLSRTTTESKTITSSLTGVPTQTTTKFTTLTYKTATTTTTPLPGSISGRIYSDDNGNGQYDGDVIDTPIGSVGVELTGTDWQGNVIYQITQTQAQTGVYQFLALDAGDYNIHEVQPLGYHNPLTGAQDDIAITITSGLNAIDQDFIDVPG